ncbi:RYR3 protein, partial [Polioptila caerulea]|nr:RYR3 protein [Polioptila caerulea]
TLKELISQTMVRWSQEDQIQDPELVRIMYSLLRRQYDSIGELLQALRKAYTISAVSVKDTINLLAALGQIRSLLSVRMGKEEELLMINGLGYGINRILFSKCLRSEQKCIPFVLPFLCSCLMFYPVASTPNRGVSSDPSIPYLVLFCPATHFSYIFGIVRPIFYLLLIFCLSFNFAQFDCLLCAVAPLFLCLFGHIFHIIPCLDIESAYTVAVVTYLAGCGLQSCPVLLAKGYPDIGWNPIEGERYLSFLRFAVFANSESVEENASVVVKLLIR